jgi:3-isopropylmalate dehydrogenase
LETDDCFQGESTTGIVAGATLLRSKFGEDLHVNSYRIAVVEGDGIGPEVMAFGIEVLETAVRLVGGVDLEFLPAPAGAGTYLECGDDLPARTLATCREADAILLGACGLPEVRRPDGTELTPQITLRRELELYAGIRPARLLSGVPCPLAGDPEIDLVIVRESTEGLFASLGAGVVLGGEVAADTQVITRRGTERVVRAAFDLARRRGKPEPRVTCVDKANVLRSFAFFRKVFDEVAAGYPDVAADHLYVDAAALELVRRPCRIDVIVTENMFGDILSDLAAGLIGGMGMAPSADVGDRHAVFQPCHGTAPDIAGKGIANPVATILSCAMLLEYLARTRCDNAARSAGLSIERAVAAALSDGRVRPSDLGGNSSTREVAGAILALLSRAEGPGS